MSFLLFGSSWIFARQNGGFRPCILCAVFAFLLQSRICAAEEPEATNWMRQDHSHDSRLHFLREMPSTIRADHPAILPIAAAIREISLKPLEQLVIVNDVTHLLVDYDEDQRVYGQADYHATLDEMLARRRAGGWLYLRDDCDGRAVFAAHLLASLGIKWHLEASYWKGHAWVTAEVDGKKYDLLDLREKTPEISRMSYRLLGKWVTPTSHPPKNFDWREAWRTRTGGDVAVGLRLGLLEIGATTAHWRERYSTDWTKTAPNDKNSPFDSRLLTANYAAFPLGEALHPGPAAIAGVTVESRETAPVGTLGQASSTSTQLDAGKD